MENTLGKQRVGFQEKEAEHIRSVRLKVAGLIDELQMYRASYENTNLASPEKQRLISIAQTKLEEACMFAVRALYAE